MNFQEFQHSSKKVIGAKKTFKVTMNATLFLLKPK